MLKCILKRKALIIRRLVGHGILITEGHVNVNRAGKTTSAMYKAVWKKCKMPARYQAIGCQE